MRRRCAPTLPTKVRAGSEISLLGRNIDLLAVMILINIEALLYQPQKQNAHLLSQMSGLSPSGFVGACGLKLSRQLTPEADRPGAVSGVGDAAP
jgi:hypothetical protein